MRDNLPGELGNYMAYNANNLPVLVGKLLAPSSELLEVAAVTLPVRQYTK